MFNQLKTVALMAALAALLVGLGSAYSPEHAQFFLVLALAINGFAWAFSDQIVLRMHGARELSREEAPQLYDILDELAARAGIPVPRLYLVPSTTPNAFATGRSPSAAAVAVTEGLVRLLDRRELRGVIAHELGHVINRDTTIATLAAVMATTITHLASSMRWALVFGGGRRDRDDGPGAGAWLVALVAPLAAGLLQLALSRSREYLADETAARLTGDPEALARALLKLERGLSYVPAEAVEPATASLYIVNPLTSARSFLAIFSTHPPIEDRVERLRALAFELRGQVA